MSSFVKFTTYPFIDYTIFFHEVNHHVHYDWKQRNYKFWSLPPCWCLWNTKHSLTLRNEVPDSIKKGNERITIAKFEKREDADYALLMLFSFIQKGGHAWSPRSCPVLSQVWEKVKQKLSDDRHITLLTKNAILDVTGADHITIIYASRYEKEWDSDLLNCKQRKVSEEVVNHLQDSISPIRYCPWEASDEISE